MARDKIVHIWVNNVDWEWWGIELRRRKSDEGIDASELFHRMRFLYEKYSQPPPNFEVAKRGEGRVNRGGGNLREGR